MTGNYLSGPWFLHLTAAPFQIRFRVRPTPSPAPHAPAKGVTPTQRWVGTLSVNERPGPLHNPGLGSVLSENLNASQETGVRQRGGDPARDGIPVHRNSIGRCNRQIVFLCNIKSKIWYTTPPCVSPVLRKASRRIMDWF